MKIENIRFIHWRNQKCVGKKREVHRDVENGRKIDRISREICGEKEEFEGWRRGIESFEKNKRLHKKERMKEERNKRR